MTTWQKIIKYGAILLAFFLIFQIIFLILWGFRLFGSFLGLYDEEEVVCSSHMTEIASENTFPSKLDIELNFTHLVIQRGSEFQVSSNSSAITYEKKSLSNDFEIDMFKFQKIREHFNKKITELRDSFYCFKKII